MDEKKRNGGWVGDFPGRVVYTVIMAIGMLVVTIQLDGKPFLTWLMWVVAVAGWLFFMRAGSRPD